MMKAIQRVESTQISGSASAVTVLHRNVTLAAIIVGTLVTATGGGCTVEVPGTTTNPMDGSGSGSGSDEGSGSGSGTMDPAPVSVFPVDCATVASQTTTHCARPGLIE